MPKVLCVLNRLVIGGPAIVAAPLAKYLSPDFETLIVVGGKDDHEQEATHLTTGLGIQPVEIPEMKRELNWSGDISAYRKMKQVIRDFRPDIIHTHAAKSGAIGRLAASAVKVPVIVHTFHGHVFHSYFSPLKTKAFIQVERYLAKKSTGIIAISDQQKHELANIYRICPIEKIRVIKLGLDLEKFGVNQKEKRKAFREQYQIDEDEIAVGIVGRIVPIKNHSLFVAASKKVLEKSNRKIRFVVVGDGDMREHMENEFSNAGIDYAYYPREQRKAIAIGTSWLTEMDFVFAGLDIVALTSNNEGTPVSLIEGQAAAKPVVSTNVGGVSDVMLEGKTGFAVPAEDVDTFASSLLKLVDDFDLRKKFGEAGREFAFENFSIERMARDTATYYNQLLQNKDFLLKI